MLSPLAKLFQAHTGSFWDTMMPQDGTTGYVIPVYQRQYNWSEEHIDRLLKDYLNGFFRLSESSAPDYTFLGSIILASGPSEPTFSGTSKIIVDGQQRLTTLVLISCVLYQVLRNHSKNTEFFPEITQEWIAGEISTQLETLYECIFGIFKRQLEGTVPYPRLIRAQVDHRGPNLIDCEYSSPLGRFLHQFSHHTSLSNQSFDPSFSDSPGEPSRLVANYNHIRGILESYFLQSATSIFDGDVPVVGRSLFDFANYRRMFRETESFVQDDMNRSFAALGRSSTSEPAIRALLASFYLTQRVVLARVEAQSEEYAFDIFDALNTSGEPLTALETCKPLVTHFEQTDGSGYGNSPSRDDWEIIETELDKAYPESDKRQRETKQLLVSYALYHDGSKLPLDLSSQRHYMRDRFQLAQRGGLDLGRRFVHSLRDVALFRLKYWERSGIDDLGLSGLGPEDGDTLKLCLRFIADMRTSLAVPILARYWAVFGESDDTRAFLRATKAVAAFLAIRRAVTGSTAGIDSYFRKIMSDGPSNGSDPLCEGLSGANKLRPPAELCANLADFLAVKQVGVHDRQSWVERAREVELGNSTRAPRPLARFLILAASHDTWPDPQRSGMMTKDDLTKGSGISTFTHAHWVGDKYATVEHVAPETNPGLGWQGSIYTKPSTRNKIGNLLLLPEKENQGIGNAGWKKKNTFYNALASETQSDRETWIALAKEEGYEFGVKTRGLLRSQDCLHLLGHTLDVDNWTEELIEERTDNILELAWERISPWLFE